MSEEICNIHSRLDVDEKWVKLHIGDILSRLDKLEQQQTPNMGEQLAKATENLGRILLPAFEKVIEQLPKVKPTYALGQRVQVSRSCGDAAYGTYEGRIDDTILAVKLDGEINAQGFHSDRVTSLTYTRGQEVEVRACDGWYRGLYVCLEPDSHYNKVLHRVYTDSTLQSSTYSSDQIRPLQKESK